MVEKKTIGVTQLIITDEDHTLVPVEGVNYDVKNIGTMSINLRLPEKNVELESGVVAQVVNGEIANFIGGELSSLRVKVNSIESFDGKGSVDFSGTSITGVKSIEAQSYIGNTLEVGSFSATTGKVNQLTIGTQAVTPGKFLPIGYTHIRIPGTPSPANLFGGVWRKVQMDGAFLRLDGGNAKSFTSSGKNYWDKGHMNSIKQNDAIRNITGKIPITDMGNENFYGGAFSGVFRINRRFYDKSTGYLFQGDNGYFDASRVVPTANENRPVNITIEIYIKTGY